MTIAVSSSTIVSSSAIRLHQRATGGGPRSNQELTKFEERVVSFISPEAVHGIEGDVPLDSDSASINHVPQHPSSMDIEIVSEAGQSNYAGDFPGSSRATSDEMATPTPTTSRSSSASFTARLRNQN
ncbi:unnamed protein product [Callosobruchus maculatus]|uniref:Uncharacterized protein n=1 Tax=Callosobruchus maculatus TaxID=64391 RepID=A0A653CI48_CALMS|nr:unnamed protein product [Callosobruchus maculatus]